MSVPVPESVILAPDTLTTLTALAAVISVATQVKVGEEVNGRPVTVTELDANVTCPVAICNLLVIPVPAQVDVVPHC